MSEFGPDEKWVERRILPKIDGSDGIVRPSKGRLQRGKQPSFFRSHLLATLYQ
jgi:hypothetical protein